MTVQEKLNKYTPIAQVGDIILFRGTAFISKAIILFDKAYFTHSATVSSTTGGISIIQSTIDKKGDGMQYYSLADELIGDTDFVVLRLRRTESQIESGLQVLRDKVREHSKYNILFYIKFLIYLATKWDIKEITSRNSYVCSQAVQLYTDAENILEYKTEDLITPQYIWDNINTNNIYIIVDKGL